MSDARLSHLLREQQWLDLVLGVLRLGAMTPEEVKAVRNACWEIDGARARIEAEAEDRMACKEALAQLEPFLRGLGVQRLSTREGEVVYLTRRSGSPRHLLNRAGLVVCRRLVYRAPREGDLVQVGPSWIRTCEACTRRTSGLRGVHRLRAVIAP